MVIRRIKRHGARFSVYLVAFILLKAAWWLKAKFGSPTIDQIIFHLQNGNDGLIDADPKIISSFIRHVLVLPVVFAIATFTAQQLVMSKRVGKFLDKESAEIVSSWPVRILASTLGFLRIGFNRFIPILILLACGTYLSLQVAMWSHLRNLEVSTFIDDNYVKPINIKAPKHKTNLVLIYVESLENGYTDPSLMGSNLLATLDKATDSAYRFDDYEQTYGTGWTIAGIVGTQCGIPLKSHTMFDGNGLGEQVKSFLPGAVCLGDILAKQGYRNVFLGGASQFFAGKGKFFSQHGYSEIFGREEWARNGEKNFNDWGLYDDRLLQRAKTKIDQLEKANRPFNLTLLTVDTHPPHGHISPTCAKKGVKDYKGILTCTADLIADFVMYMKQRGYLKNTVVVILGDHLSMQAPLEDELSKGSKRTIYNRIIAHEKLQQNRQKIYHFGMLPSILYAMGFRFKGNRLALGASGFGEIDPSFILPDLNSDNTKDLLAKRSKRYSDFWQTDQQTNALSEQH